MQSQFTQFAVERLQENVIARVSNQYTSTGKVIKPGRRTYGRLVKSGASLREIHDFVVANIANYEVIFKEVGSSLVPLGLDEEGRRSIESIGKNAHIKSGPWAFTLIDYDNTFNDSAVIGFTGNQKEEAGYYHVFVHQWAIHRSGFGQVQEILFPQQGEVFRGRSRTNNKKIWYKVKQISYFRYKNNQAKIYDCATVYLQFADDDEIQNAISDEKSKINFAALPLRGEKENNKNPQEGDED